MQSVNGVAGTKSARNQGAYSTSGICGDPALAWGANNYTVYYAGQPITVKFDINGHTPQGVWQIQLSRTGNNSQFASNVVREIPFTDPAQVVTQAVSLFEVCDKCSLQGIATGYGWGTCTDFQLIPIPGKTGDAALGIVANGKIDYNDPNFKITCNFAYKLEGDTCVECNECVGALTSSATSAVAQLVVVAAAVMALVA